MILGLILGFLALIVVTSVLVLALGLCRSAGEMDERLGYKEGDPER